MNSPLPANMSDLVSPVFIPFIYLGWNDHIILNCTCTVIVPQDLFYNTRQTNNFDTLVGGEFDISSPRIFMPFRGIIYLLWCMVYCYCACPMFDNQRDPRKKISTEIPL